jgi:HEAT repeat protein
VATEVASLATGGEEGRVPGEPGEDAPWRRGALEALRRAFPDRDVELFTGGAVALGKGGSPADAAALLEALKGRFADPTVRESCVLGLGLLGRRAPGGREALAAIVLDRRDSSRLRSVAGIALGVSGDPSAVPILLAAARERGPSRDPAAGALVGLGLLAEPLVVPDLAAMLADASNADARALRPFAAYALGRTGGGEAASALLRALGDGDAQVRRAAVLALGECDPADAAGADAVLYRLAREDRDRPVRCFALVALARLGGNAAMDALARGYATGDRYERDFAALGLGILLRGSPDAGARGRVASMLRADFLNRKDADLRGALAVALGLLRDDRSVPALRAVARDRGVDPEVRAHCALALGLAGARDAAPELRESLKERGNPGLQREAALALGLLGDAGAAGVLADAIRHGGEYVRVSAAAALGKLGGPRAALPLVDLLADREASGLARGQAAVGLGLLLDPRPVGGLAAISSGLDYLAATPGILEVLTIP